MKMMLTGAALAAVMGPAALAQDIEGSADHPLLSRFAGSEIIAQEAAEYEAVVLPAGPVADHRDDDLELVALEGRASWTAYRAPEGRREIEIARNYEAALEAGGFDIVFTCAGASECGRGMSRLISGTSRVFPRDGFAVRAYTISDGARAVLASRQDEDGAVHAFIFTGQRNRNDEARVIWQVIVEEEAMATGQVEVGVRSASELQAGLEAGGRVVVEGVFFAHDSDAIEDRSADAIAQMAALLSDQPGIEVVIVGHTDNQGALDYNRSLSARRAAAVRQALIDDHGIAAGRMTAEGVAFLAPAASNATEDGREQNRRVELVLR
jgi:OmpA-OmpF porin, OOP family